MRSFELVYRRCNRIRRRHAFSLVELLVVLGILIILCSIFIPYVGKMRETNKRVGCIDNLRQIHLALKTYADANSFELPRVPSDPAAPGTYVAFTGAAFVTPVSMPVTTATSSAPATAPATRPAEGAATPRVGPDLAVSPPATAPATQPATRPATAPAPAPVRPAKDAVQFNDVTASLWLIVRLGYVSPQAFICPSSSDTVDPMLTGGKRVPAQQRLNFTSGRHLSYSYSSPYSAAPRFRLNSDTLPPDFAVMADKNPGAGGKTTSATPPAYNAPPLALAAANSRNHDRAGQHVLYVTGEVRFQTTPYCGVGTGWERDNIYTAYAAEPVPADRIASPQAPGVLSRNVGPAWANDSYLVPTDDE